MTALRGFLLFIFAVLGGECFGQSLRQTLFAQGNPEFYGNRVELLPTATEKYERMFQSIREAKNYVHVEYFSVTHDSVGSSFMDLLEEKARQGVEVRLIIDGYGNMKSHFPMTKGRKQSLTEAGVRWALFDPIRFPWFNHIRHRDHRKIVVVDGREAFTGGMNVARYYITGTKRSGQWRDMHICLRGPVVDEYERIFERIWQKETREEMDTLRYRNAWQTAGETTISVVNREPGRLSKAMRKAYVAALDAAKHEVRIVNPYPTNVRSVRRAIRRALKRGVTVKMMVSGSSDVTLTPDVVAIEMKKLLKHGCQVYYYDGGFHHTKVMTIDGEQCTIGTANIDGRSMLFDYEVNVFVFDAGVTTLLDAIFDEDLKQSELLTTENFKERFSAGHRMVGRMLTPVRTVF